MLKCSGWEQDQWKKVWEKTTSLELVCLWLVLGFCVRFSIYRIKYNAYTMPQRKNPQLVSEVKTSPMGTLQICNITEVFIVQRSTASFIHSSSVTVLSWFGSHWIQSLSKEHWEQKGRFHCRSVHLRTPQTHTFSHNYGAISHSQCTYLYVFRQWGETRPPKGNPSIKTKQNTQSFTQTVTCVPDQTGDPGAVK